MLKYVIKRLLILIPVLLGVVFIVFMIMQLTPGDPGRIILGTNATQEEVDELNEDLGYYDPLPVKFVDYVAKALTGDFGRSYRTNQPVFDQIFEKFPVTLTLALLSIILVVLISVPTGILSAVKQYSKIDISVTVLAMFMAAIPTFWLGLLLILLFALQLNLLPSFGVGSWQGYILPTITMAIPSAAIIIRMTRSTMLETIREDYIRTARAKGAPERVIIWKHALRNALLPIITLVGISFGGLLGGTILVEKVFGLPGLGSLMVTSIGMKDIPMVMACTIFLAALFCIILLIVDLMYAFVDPRVKAQFIK
jgi:peptide/nickel transport system permease protein